MKGMSVRSIILLCSLLSVPLSALADTHVFDYNYLDVGHARYQPDGGQAGSGTYADLSYGFLDDVQLRVGYTSLSFPLGVSYKDYDVGVTGESAINAQTDIFTDILYLNDRYDHIGHYITDDGYRLAVGMRHHPAQLEWMELDGWLAHNWMSANPSPAAGMQQAFLPPSSSEIGAGVMFQPIHWLSFGLSYAHAFNAGNTTSLRVRFYFGDLHI
jgi:outer membrane receptor protein involved in Fe transport